MSQSVERVYQALRGEILSGTRPAQTRLREEQVAADLGVSRTPVREAIRRLAADSLVTLTPHRGAVVRRWDADDYEEIFDLRELLESHAAARAAASGTADVGALATLCDRMEQLGADLRAGTADPDAAYAEITALNLALHRAVHAAAGRLVPDLLSGLIEVPLVRRTFHRYSAEQMQRSFAQHRDLVAAIAAGDDGWAAAVMTAHLRSARTTFRLDVLGSPDLAAASPVPGAEES